MKGKRLTEEQIAYELRQAESVSKDSGNHVLSACGLRRYAASDRSTYL
jgi:hypothetical protein